MMGVNLNLNSGKCPFRPTWYRTQVYGVLFPHLLRTGIPSDNELVSSAIALTRLINTRWDDHPFSLITTTEALNSNNVFTPPTDISQNFTLFTPGSTDNHMSLDLSTTSSWESNTGFIQLTIQYINKHMD